MASIADQGHHAGCALNREWLAVFESYGPVKYQMSSSVNINGWRVAIEHQRLYRSIVIEDTHREPPRHIGHPDIRRVPPSDRKKGWHYRLIIAPNQFQAFVSAFLRAGP